MKIKKLSLLALALLMFGGICFTTGCKPKSETEKAADAIKDAADDAADAVKDATN